MPIFVKCCIYSFRLTSNPIKPAKPATPPEIKNAVDVAN